MITHEMCLMQRKDGEFGEEKEDDTQAGAAEIATLFGHSAGQFTSTYDAIYLSILSIFLSYLSFLSLTCNADRVRQGRAKTSSLGTSLHRSHALGSPTPAEGWRLLLLAFHLPKVSQAYYGVYLSVCLSVCLCISTCISTCISIYMPLILQILIELPHRRLGLDGPFKELLRRAVKAGALEIVSMLLDR